MNLRYLLIRNLWYFRRLNFATVLCVVVAASVLTGALLVGDSMRGSLRDLTLKRLGKVDYVMQSSRMFRAGLANQIADELRTETSQSHCVAGILLRASVVQIDESGKELGRANRVQAWGVNQQFWALSQRAKPPEFSSNWGSGDDLVINRQLADELGVEIGDTVVVRIEKPSDVPRDALLAKKDLDSTVAQLRRSVSSIIEQDSIGRIGFEPFQIMPRNLFIPLEQMQRETDQSGRINLIMVDSAEAKASELAFAEDYVVQLQEIVKNHLSLEDIGVTLNEHPDGEYISLESNRLILESAVSDAASHYATIHSLNIAPTIAYLANSIRKANGGGRTIPYSVVVTVQPDVMAPFGPLSMTDGTKINRLEEDEIVLNTWAAERLNLKPDEEVELVYYAAEPSSPSEPYEERTATFKFSGIVEMSGPGNDRHIIPEYPGITDARSIVQWNSPFPMDKTRVIRDDEDYWELHKGTPKAFISLITGERLWSSRFGTLTSVRFDRPENAPENWHVEIDRGITRLLTPKDLGLGFRPVRAQGLSSSQGANDFSGLFIGFSFFIIISAIILIALVFRLGVERRAAEMGLLSAIGVRAPRVRRLMLFEGAILSIVGTVVGIGGAIGYAWLMIAGLRTWWVGAVGTNMLELHVTSNSVGIGAAISLFMALGAMIWSLRGIAKISPRALLSGTTSDVGVVQRRNTRASRVGVGLAGLAIVLAVAGWWMQQRVALFFVVGGLLLVAGILLLLGQFSIHGLRMITGGVGAITRLGIRNGARNRGRSTLTSSLIAFSTFMIIAVAANRQESINHEIKKDSGNGGFGIVAESDIALAHNPNSETGRLELGFSDDEESQFWPTDQPGTNIYPFRLLPGEDASCLNLYQPARPRILGASESFVARGGFRIQSSLAETDAERDNPWLLLDKKLDDDVIPAFGDANSVQWIIKSGLGKNYTMTLDDGSNVTVRFVGLLSRSLFQSEIVIGDSSFRRAFPHISGWSYFLAEAPETLATDELSQVLESRLSDFGLDATSTLKRLDDYHAVENTYLSTFQTLGGLGLVLGTIGLGAVLLRSTLERRSELALMRAVGFRPSKLMFMVFAESAFLLLAGMSVGSIAALVAVFPHLAQAGGEVPWISIGSTLALVVVVGLASGVVSMITALKAPLLSALRGD